MRPAKDAQDALVAHVRPAEVLSVPVYNHDPENIFYYVKNSFLYALKVFGIMIRTSKDSITASGKSLKPGKPAAAASGLMPEMLYICLLVNLCESPARLGGRSRSLRLNHIGYDDGNTKISGR
jgi:hypothetical protein